MPRIAPVEPPYSDEIQAIFDRIMPEGVAPLSLFRTLARSERVYRKFHAGGLLDRGSLSLRQRELAIDRTCALNGCDYEWGIHIAFFAERVKLSAQEVEALARPGLDPARWPADEAAILMLCDELHATSRISGACWSALTDAFSEEQILELIALAGFYRTVAYFANGLELEPEPFGAPLPVENGSK